MKIQDFLAESATVIAEGYMSDEEWAKSKYWELFVDNLRNGQTLFNFKTKDGDDVPGRIQDSARVAKQVEQIYGSDYDEKTRKSLLKQLTVTVSNVDEEDQEIPGPGFVARITQILKDEKVTGTLNPNMGDVAEAVLGCAVTAKFEKRGAEIDVNDAFEVGRRVAESNGVLTTGTGKDQLYFRVSIPEISKKAFYAFLGKDPKQKTLKDYNVPDKKIAQFNSYFKSAVAYANTSKRVELAMQKVQADKRKNAVDVISDGGEKANQRITKVDLKVLVDGTSINLLSIKAGAVSQFGQVAGANFNHLNEFFLSTVGLKLSDVVKKKFIEVPKGMQGQEALDLKMKNYQQGFKNAYAEIHKQLQAMSKNDPAGLIKRVFKGTLQHLTRGEEGVEMVILEPNAKKAFSELSFGPEFYKAMNQLQLFAVAAHTANDYIIHIYGIPKTQTAKKVFNDKEKLITLRSRIERKKNFRNVIGMGGLLKDIADIEKIIQKPATKPKQAPVPVAKQPTATAVNTRTIKPAPEPGIAEPAVAPVPRARRASTATTVRPRR